MKTAGILRNSLANLTGGVVPALVTLLTLPFIVAQLGAESYGVLVLITAIMGYFSVLDLNVTAGSVKYVAEHHATGDVGARNETIACGLALYVVVGLAGCAALSTLAETLVERVFVVPPELRSDAGDALQLAGVGFLFGQTQIYLQSVLQGLQRYDWSAVIESAFGSLVPVATVGVLWLGYGLFEIVAVRAAASAINVILLGIAIRRLLPDFDLRLPRRAVLEALARFSGYSYLSRLASIAYAQGDKLIIGAVLGMAPLAQYAVPFMLVNRVFGLTFRLGAVLFPVASALNAANDTHRLREIYLYGVRYTLFVNTALACALSAFATEVLHYWMGPEVAASGAAILAVLAIAALLDSVTNIPSLVNDGLGHPRVTGLFAVGRAVLGLVLTTALVTASGVTGAACAQLITAILAPTLFLAFLHGRTIPVALTRFFRVAILPTLPLVVVFGACAVLRWHAEPLGLRGMLVVMPLALAVLAGYGILFVFRRSDRVDLMARLTRRNPAG